MRKTYDNLSHFFNDAKNIVDKKKMHDKIGVELLLLTDDNFRGEKSPEGLGWLKLSTRTLAARRNPNRKNGKSNSTKILQDRGILRSSIDYIASSDETELGTDKDYARKHNEGIEVPRRSFFPTKKVPKRYVKAIQSVLKLVMEQETA